jgi:hypothetical protein
MLNTVKNAMHTIGDGTGDLAKRFGGGTARLAKRVGPKRAIIGIAVIGVVVGGSIMLARYLRARKEELPLEGSDEQMPGQKVRRNAKRGIDAQFSH